MPGDPDVAPTPFDVRGRRVRVEDAAGRRWGILAGRVATQTGIGMVERGLVVGSGNRVEEVLPASATPDPEFPVLDLGGATLVPGLVNAHTHLGLSHLGPARRGLSPPGRPSRAEPGGTCEPGSSGLTFGRGFAAWAASLVPRLGEPLPAEVLHAAVEQMAECGTALVADIAGRNCGAVAGALEEAGLDFRLLVEFFGFRPPGATLPWPPFVEELSVRVRRERMSAAGHALYSTHPETLRLAKAWCREQGRPFSIHLAEPRGERRLLLDGTGELADFYRRAGVLPRDFRPPGRSPVAVARDLGLLDEATLAVHCVHLSSEDADILAESGARAVLCPRSNDLIGVGRPPLALLRRAGVRLCLATDGLSSNQDMDLTREMGYIAQWPDCPPMMDLLGATSLVPAQALGADGDFGSIGPGKRAVFAVLPDELAARLGRGAS